MLAWNPYWLRCASSQMTTMLCRSERTGKLSSSSPGVNFWMVVKTMPPDGRLASSSRSRGRVSACTGVSRSSSAAPAKTPNSWLSRSLRSVTTTSVGLPMAGCCISLPPRQVISMLLPAPWVCHTTPPLPRRDASALGLDASSTLSTTARTAWNWW